MYYLVGTYHSTQCLGLSNEKESKAFKKYLHELCKEFDIHCIAEEYNEDSATENGCIEVCCQAVALERGIDHCFCDPDRNQRAELGISDWAQLKRKQFYKNWTDDKFYKQLSEENLKRENFWLNAIRLSCSDHDNVLVVIGADHINSFSSILLNEGEEYLVLNDDYIESQDNP